MTTLSASSAPSTDTPHRVSTEAAAERLRAMAEEDAPGSGVKCTIKIGAGPEMPFDKAAEKKLKEHFSETIQAAKGKPPRPGGIAADQLRAIVERIERLEEEKAGLASDVRDIFAEAKGNGYDIPTLRKILKLRAMDASERDEAQHLLDTYCAALGMQTSFNFEGEE